MAQPIRIYVRGLRELYEAFGSLQSSLSRVLADAATLAGDQVLNTEGLRRYPPEGPGNRPPYPYYVRGRGLQVSPTRNMGNSERLGTRFYSLGEVRAAGGAVIRIGNTASYARYVVGNEQARAMGRIGWRRLSDVARERASDIGRVFEAVIDAALKRASLR